MEASGGFESGHGSCEIAGVHCRCCSVPGQSGKAVSNSKTCSLVHNIPARLAR